MFLRRHRSETEQVKKCPQQKNTSGAFAMLLSQKNLCVRDTYNKRLNICS